MRRSNEEYEMPKNDSFHVVFQILDDFQMYDSELIQVSFQIINIYSKFKLPVRSSFPLNSVTLR